MEWLTGETLSDRLARGALTIDESMTRGCLRRGCRRFLQRRSRLHRHPRPRLRRRQARLDDGLDRHAVIEVRRRRWAAIPTRLDEASRQRGPVALGVGLGG